LERQEQTIDSLVESLHAHDLTKQEVHLLEDRIQEMAGTVPPEGSVRAGTGELGTEVLRTFTGHETAVRAVGVSEGCLYTASEDGMIHKWDLTTGRIQLSFAGHRDWVTCLALEEGILFSGSADSTARLWDASDGKCETVFVGHTDAVWGVAVSGEFLFTASSDNTVRHWEMETGVSIKVLRGHSDCVWTLVLDDQGRLYSGSDDCTLRVWDVDTGETDKVLTGHKAGVLSLCAENQKILSGSGDGTVRVWDPANGFSFEVYSGHGGPVTTVTARGSCVFSGSVDMTIQMWTMQECTLIHEFRGHTQEVTSVCISSGNLFAGSDSGTVHQYFTDGMERHAICGDLVGELMGIDNATKSTLEKMEADRAMALDELRTMKGQLDLVMLEGEQGSASRSASRSASQERQLGQERQQLERQRLLQRNKIERVIDRMLVKEPMNKSLLRWRLNSAKPPVRVESEVVADAFQAVHEHHAHTGMTLEEMRTIMNDPFHGFGSFEELQEALVADDRSVTAMQAAAVRQASNHVCLPCRTSVCIGRSPATTLGRSTCVDTVDG